MPDEGNAVTVPARVTSKISDIKLPVLRPDNYVEWKIKITSLLKAKDLFTFVEMAPTDEEKVHEQFDRINEEAKTIIYSSLDSKTTQAAGICDTAHSLWEKVVSSYEGVKEDLTGIAMSGFMEIAKRSDEKMTDYLGRYEIALNRLLSVQTLSMYWSNHYPRKSKRVYDSGEQ